MITNIWKFGDISQSTKCVLGLSIAALFVSIPLAMIGRATLPLTEKGIEAFSEKRAFLFFFCSLNSIIWGIYSLAQLP